MKTRPALFLLALLQVALLLDWEPVSVAAEPSLLTLEMTEFRFRPNTLSVRPKQMVRLRLVNRGKIAHQFETAYLRGTAVTVKGGVTRVEARGLGLVRLDPGGVAAVDFLPRRAGRFIFACTIEGHREAGMWGVLEVR